MPSRYVCSVLEEMRDTVKCLNVTTVGRSKQFLPMLIEEVQTMVNRMEAALGEKWQYGSRTEELAKLKKEVRKLKKEKKELKGGDEEPKYRRVNEMLLGGDDE